MDLRGSFTFHMPLVHNAHIIRVQSPPRTALSLFSTPTHAYRHAESKCSVFFNQLYEVYFA